MITVTSRLAVFASVLGALTSVPVAGSAATTTWEIDAAHSSAQFSIRHLMISNVRGEFVTMSGAVHVDDADPTKSVVEGTIDAASIDTRNAKRDEHLRSPDFLDTAKFPTITFKSKRIEKAGTGWKIVGDLTLHGVTREVALDLTDVSPQQKDGRGNVKVGGQATTKINRKDFGIVWNQALDGGGVAVGDEVSITLDVEVVRKAQ